ncbi:hypothetical protein LI90_3586 [Carbonactinospora thermoautotrophica]|uniref:Uncharacterized protein n=1 Tax=Carbonactinospora thermoautotrophica TaxID=1469144 RepID=A0A132MXG9_9ACTN|nr:hypothetical protein LI90_3586 [Carbonactinospora thermoautotrophica]
MRQFRSGGQLCVRREPRRGYGHVQAPARTAWLPLITLGSGHVTSAALRRMRSPGKGISQKGSYHATPG